MELLPARKIRASLAVEPLEDRRMLSMFAPAQGWVSDARPIDNQVETGPISGGSVAPMQGEGLDSPVFDQSPSGWFDSPGFDRQGFANSPDSAPVGWPLTSPMAPNSPRMFPSSSDESAAASSGPDARGSGEASIASVPGTSTAASIAPMVFPLSLPTRSAPGLSSARSASEVVSATAKGDLVAVDSQAGRTSSDETLLAVASANAPASESSPSPDQARTQVSIYLPIGPGLNSPQKVSGLTLSTIKDPSDLASPAETPIGSGSLMKGTDRPVSIGSPGEGGSVETIELPEPDLAGMIQGFLPFDRLSVEGAIDRFLEPFDGLASTMTELRGPMGLMTASLATAATVVAVEVALRLRRNREQELAAEEVDGMTTFPGI